MLELELEHSFFSGGSLRISIALLTGVLFLLPHAARAQTAAPSPSAAPAASPAPAPVDKATLTIPDGWTKRDYPMDMGSFKMISMWYSPKGGGDNINLGYSPNPSSENLAGVVPQVRTVLAKMLGSANVTDRAEKLCNGSADGWLFTGRVTLGEMHMIIEEAILPSTHQVFGATYTRLSSHGEDPAARKALDSLCVKS